MAMVTAPGLAPPAPARTDAARTELARGDGAGFALLLGALDGEDANAPAPEDTRAATAEVKDGLPPLPPDPPGALVPIVTGATVSPAPPLVLPAAPSAASEPAPAATALAPPMAGLSPRGDLPLPPPLPAALPPQPAASSASLPDAPALAPPRAGSSILPPPLVPMGGPAPSNEGPDPAPLARTPALGGDALHLPRPLAASLPIDIDKGAAARPLAEGALSRPGRAPATSAGVAVAESPASAQLPDGPAVPPGLVPVADVRSAPPQSGPERTEPGAADTPPFPTPDTHDAADAATAESRGHVQSARLTMGQAERLSITLATTSETSRVLLERESPELAGDLAAAGAKVEAIRVDLAHRVNPDGRGDATGGPHPGPGQGGGAPWDRGAPPAAAEAPKPDAPVADRKAGRARSAMSDGGKVDRYA